MIGISTGCFYPKMTENAINIIADMGFEKVEVFLNTETEMSFGYLQDLNKLCKSFNIKICSAHPYTSFAETYLFFSDYERRFNDGIEQYKRYFYNISAAGIKIFNFHGAFVSKNISPEKYADIYYKLKCLAASNDLIFSQENVSSCNTGKLSFMSRLSDLLKSDINFTLDIKQANRAGEDPFDFVKELKEKIVLVHINDFDKENECLLPGMGSFDFKAFKNEMDRQKYSGDFMIEVYSDRYSLYEEIVKSKNELEELFSK